MPRGQGQEGKRRQLYTPAEDALIRKLYYANREALMLRIPHSASSIRARAQKLGVVKRYGKRTSKPAVQPEAKLKVDVGDCRGLRAVAIGEPIPVRDAERKLASFDKAIARCVRERDLGLAPGALLNQNALQ